MFDNTANNNDVNHSSGRPQAPEYKYDNDRRRWNMHTNMAGLNPLMESPPSALDIQISAAKYENTQDCINIENTHEERSTDLAVSLYPEENL